ncbi:MAG: energy transducer TonB [Terriglobales bacterium]
MFEQSLIQPGAGRRRPAAVAFSLALQAAGIGALVIVPLWHYAALPDAAALSQVAALMAPKPRPIAPRAAGAEVVRLAIAAAPAALMAPAAVPLAVAPPMTATPALGLGVPEGGVGSPSGWPGGLRVGAPAGPPGPPTPGPIRVGGDVQAALCLACPPPGYPALARMAGISGVVLLAATIGRDGRVRELRVIRGSPLLAGAALRTVSRWRYRPTELNGKPVRVETAIRVAFQLR